jgi:hypothetical protein
MFFGLAWIIEGVAVTIRRMNGREGSMNIIQRLLARFKPKPKFQPITCKVVDGKMIIDIRIPANAPEDEVLKAVESLVKGISMAHIAHGGSGLTVEDVSLIQHKPDSAVARVEGRGA